MSPASRSLGEFCDRRDQTSDVPVFQNCVVASDLDERRAYYFRAFWRLV
jgi:hypothetical protein